MKNYLVKLTLLFELLCDNVYPSYKKPSRSGHKCLRGCRRCIELEGVGAELTRLGFEGMWRGQESFRKTGDVCM